MEVAIMDFQFFTIINKITVSLLFIGLIGLLSPKAIAQETAITTEDNTPKPENFSSLGGIEDLEGLEPRSFTDSSGRGGALDDNPKHDSTYLLQIDSGIRPEVNSSLGLKVNPDSENWLHLNTGEGSRGSVTTPVFRF